MSMSETPRPSRTDNAGVQGRSCVTGHPRQDYSGFVRIPRAPTNQKDSGFEVLDSLTLPIFGSYIYTCVGS